MLVLKLELHDANTGGAVSELGRLVIANTGEGTQLYGDYVVAIGPAGGDPQTILREPQARGRVHDHPRLRASAWTLVSKALQSMGFARPQVRREAT